METERRRAWIFLRTEDPQAAAEVLREKFFPQGEDQFVVVRADLVDEARGFPFNMVVPVDAENDDVLREVVVRIVRSSGATEHVVANVKAHVPFPPHDAQGYITVQEAGLGKERIEPGRQGASPGRNPWG
jgi:hypothetical protein